MTSEAMRAKFDEWWIEKRGFACPYDDQAWDAWQAATAARDEQWRAAVQRIDDLGDCEKSHAIMALLSTGPEGGGG